MSSQAASTKSPAPSNANGTAEPTSDQQNGPASLDEGYPEQKHAGAVGLGPEYGKMHAATTGDKITGLKDQVIGKITHNQGKAEHGREQRTGELKKKEQEEADKANPFSNTDELEKKVGTDKDGDGDVQGMGGSDQQPGNEATSTATGKRGPGTHPTEKGAQEQAATTAPEGTQKAENQRQGKNTTTDKQIDES